MSVTVRSLHGDAVWGDVLMVPTQVGMGWACSMIGSIGASTCWPGRVGGTVAQRRQHMLIDQDVQAPIAEPASFTRKVTQAGAPSCSCGRRDVQATSRGRCRPTGSPAANRASRVFCQNSFGVETSMTLSARSRFSLSFSASRALRRSTSDTSIPPHFDRHMVPAVPGTPIRSARSPAQHDVTIAARMPEDRPALVWRGYERTT